MKLNLEAIMAKNRITQAQLADALGIPRATVNAWLSGQVKKGERIVVFPTYTMLERLCHFFHCRPNDLLELGDAPEGPTIKDFRHLSAA